MPSVKFGSWLRRLLTVDESELGHQFTLQQTLERPATERPDRRTTEGAAGAPDDIPNEERLNEERPDEPSNERAHHERAHQRSGEPSPERTHEQRDGSSEGRSSQGKSDEKIDGSAGDVTVIRPVPLRELLERREDERSAPEEPDRGRRAEGRGQRGKEGGSGGEEEAAPVPRSLEQVHERLKEVFHLPKNKDVIARDFRIGTPGTWPATAVFIDGMADRNVVNTHILQPLMLLSHIADETPDDRVQAIHKALLPGNQVNVVRTWDKAVQGVLAGCTTVFVEGCDAAFVVETRGWEHRQVGLTQTETVVRGPQSGFTENLRANTGLVRALLRSEHLVTEMLSVGQLGSTDIAVMYIEGLTNPRLVEEVKRRIESIHVDYLADSGLLEQFIEDQPRSLVPQILSTERPDRIAHMLTEGHVAIFVGNSPFVLAVPVVMWTLMQTPEDAYLHFPYGTFLRGIRWTALLAALLLPALYVSVTNFHPEMIPTDLLLAIAGSREQVPFPVILEVLMMEFAIELIREAGIRIPSVIGPTIGIVGTTVNRQTSHSTRFTCP